MPTYVPIIPYNLPTKFHTTYLHTFYPHIYELSNIFTYLYK